MLYLSPRVFIETDLVACLVQSVAKHREHPEYKTFAGALVALLENGQASLDVHQFQEL
ncbi:hypothetical protein PF001_g25959 [Phytophthora fragariae]|uniref:Uncharacterized protein n=1 Tax=Phytophthora fragariae TaxID=53985 RepID=A0A6A4BQE6_9STRA|nr:hypothetical protein PF003_g13555 [Phytophthora fragariae]KAE9276801.1 hypothetical protein PF001_g25959 [Phytophthora fragariae]